MKLYAKKNGKGYITTYQIIFGCREAKDLKLIDENGIVKEIENVELVKNNILQIKLRSKIIQESC